MNAEDKSTHPDHEYQQDLSQAVDASLQDSTKSRSHSNVRSHGKPTDTALDVKPAAVNRPRITRSKSRNPTQHSKTPPSGVQTQGHFKTTGIPREFFEYDGRQPVPKSQKPSAESNGKLLGSEWVEVQRQRKQNKRQRHKANRQQQKPSESNVQDDGKCTTKPPSTPDSQDFQQAKDN